MMTISVIIPVYKVEKYIRRCIESVIDQENDRYMIECLIVDDCSPDKSMIIVDDIIKNYHGANIDFKRIRHDENKGLSEARNSGIKASTGDFLFFIDSDDVILENTFKFFFAYLHDYPFVDVIMGNAMDIEDHSLTNISLTNNGSSFCLISDKRTIIYHVLSQNIDRHAWNKLIRRSLVVDDFLFFDRGLLYEDITWTYRLYSTISSIIIVPEVTYMYENNPTSIIHTPAQRSNQLIWSLSYISDSILKHPPMIRGKKVLFVAHRLFAHHWTLKALDLYEKYGANKETLRYLNNVKLTLLKDAICHLRPLMILYFINMFAPFNLLMKFRKYRSLLFRMNSIVYKYS